MKTTVIGSYPKPSYLPGMDWFRKPIDCERFCFDQSATDNAEELAEVKDRALKEIIEEQEELGIDVITDGEVNRENYVHHFCRGLQNIDFTNLTHKEVRNGATSAYLPTINGKVEALPGSTNACVEEWKKAQKLAKVADVKYTIPGPMAIIDTTFDAFYKDNRALSEDLVECINKQVLALASAGCKYIQIDEPILVRNPTIALDHGIDDIVRCFKGVGPNVVKTIHLCCGYFDYLDQEEYEKADNNAYLGIAEKLDNAGFDAISIEDANRYNNLELFRKFKKSTIILGCVKVSISKIESIAEIRERVQDVLNIIPAERLWLAPDCGLGYLPKDILQQKMENLLAAAKSL